MKNESLAYFYSVWKIAPERALPGQEYVATIQRTNEVPGNSVFYTFVGTFQAATEREAIRQALNSLNKALT